MKLILVSLAFAKKWDFFYTFCLPRSFDDFFLKVCKTWNSLKSRQRKILLFTTFEKFWFWSSLCRLKVKLVFLSLTRVEITLKTGKSQEVDSPFCNSKVSGQKNFLVNFWMRAWLREEEFILNENWLEYIKLDSPAAEGLQAEGKTLVVNGSKLCFARALE